MQDYSGFTRAAEMNAQAMQGLGQNIGKVISDYGDLKKEQSNKKKLIKQSDVQIDAAIKLFPDLAPTLQGVRDEIRNENIPIDDRAAIADSVAGLINMGTNQMRFQAEQGLQQQRIKIDRMQYESALSRQIAEQEARVREAEMENNAFSAEAIGSLSALRQLGDETKKELIPENVAVAVEDLVSKGQGKAAAGLIEKYSAGLSPALKAEFATKAQGPIINYPLPSGGTQTARVEGNLAVPIELAPSDGVPVQSGLIDVDLPLTAVRPEDGQALQEKDVPRGAEKSGEIEVGGKKFDVYINKDSPLVPVDLFGVSLPGFEAAPKDQWTHEKKYLVPQKEKAARKTGPGSPGYKEPKDNQTSLQEKRQAFAEARSLYGEGKRAEALDILNAIRVGGLLGPALRDAELDSFFGNINKQEFTTPSPTVSPSDGRPPLESILPRQ